MPKTVLSGFTHNFLCNAPAWYKQTIVLCLVINPLVLWVFGPVATGWLLVGVRSKSALSLSFCTAAALLSAFLFLLTSAIAPLVRLSYGRMVVMAFPYTLVLGGVGLLSVINFL